MKKALQVPHGWGACRIYPPDRDSERQEGTHFPGTAGIN